jgi:putative membrane protein
MAKDMDRKPYSRFDPNDLILRDKLAIDRTRLANERTLLAYLRSGAALMIAGISIMHFSTEDWFGAVGIVCIPVGIITGIVGIGRYRRMKKSISHIQSRSETEKTKPDS